MQSLKLRASISGLIYLRSHLDKYLAVDSFGNVTCESEEKDPGSVFQISVAGDGTGRWALRNVVRGYFLGAQSDKLTCTAKAPSDSEFWHVHLAARPQVSEVKLPLSNSHHHTWPLKQEACAPAKFSSI